MAPELAARATRPHNAGVEHLLGVDDAPFDKDRDASVPIVGVMAEGAGLVEAVAVTRFAVDGEEATDFLAAWIGGLRCAPALHGVVLGGVTIAGLAVIDLRRLAERLALPVMAVNRRDPSDPALAAALAAAGLSARIAVLAASPRPWPLAPGVFVTHAGAERWEVERLLRAARGKSRLPEPLRLAHLIGAALVLGQSRGRA